MTTLQALVLGIVQGAGEFLPISSSGHLIVVPWLFGWPEHTLAFDVALHLGTLFAVAYAFLGEWLALGRGLLAGLRTRSPFGTPEGRLFLQLVLASIPGAIAGKLLEEWADSTFRAPALVASTMAIMGIVLWIADARARPATAASAAPVPVVSMRDALLIGLAQSLAIVPGVSRSGSTISAGLLLGVERPEAARFSFLLAAPITFGAVILKGRKVLHESADLVPVVVGVVSAAVVGFLAIRVLLSYVRTKDYRPFVHYRLAFAIGVFTLVFLRH
jgi:undecaprenyl-diphosphatase